MQASSEAKIKRLRYISGSVLILAGSVMCIVSVCSAYAYLDHNFAKLR